MFVEGHAVNFIKEQSAASPPFLMMVATPACHAPFTPAPQYKENFNTSKAPRTPSFNAAGGSVSLVDYFKFSWFFISVNQFIYESRSKNIY